MSAAPPSSAASCTMNFVVVCPELRQCGVQAELQRLREGKATSSLVAKWAPSPGSAPLPRFRPCCCFKPYCTSLFLMESMYSLSNRGCGDTDTAGSASNAEWSQMVCLCQF